MQIFQWLGWMFRKANRPTATQENKSETLLEILGQALFDAQEILVLISLIRKQNEGTINPKLNEAGAGGAGLVLRNALIARLTLLVSRVFAKPWPKDRHFQQAIELLKDDQVLLSRGADRTEVRAAIKAFNRCRSDGRFRKIKQFRDKYTAHLGEPDKNIPAVEYHELFSFSDAVVECIERCAKAARIADVAIREQAEADSLATAFWKPWSSASNDV
jgi:AbiU2